MPPALAPAVPPARRGVARPRHAGVGATKVALTTIAAVDVAATVAVAVAALAAAGSPPPPRPIPAVVETSGPARAGAAPQEDEIAVEP